MDQCKTYVNDLLAYANSYKDDFSNQMYGAILTMGGSVAKHIGEFKNAMQGKSDTNNLIMAKQHFNYVDNLRKNNPDQYQQLLTFAKKYPSLDYDAQPQKLIGFFSKVPQTPS